MKLPVKDEARLVPDLVNNFVKVTIEGSAKLPFPGRENVAGKTGQNFQARAVTKFLATWVRQFRQALSAQSGALAQ